MQSAEYLTITSCAYSATDAIGRFTKYQHARRAQWALCVTRLVNSWIWRTSTSVCPALWSIAYTPGYT